ncbi:phosphatase PAP2 family protein [Actinomycetospora endophytica]|uniref:Phosphatase PAP2 family protein n=1 Tax=Actinomycetospora endophytica TaxID=2291215 RepID=A0ABS8PAD9_9PSEU|nr:phosphatase PAP2 family protein [Actinomycetospora endophytica]MCD2195248.1 phosphatase PAP2 family protein [Actinomycetospora endophytica]
MIIAVGGFEALWFGVVTDTGLAAVDPTVTGWLVAHRSAGLVTAARVISDVGAPAVTVTAAVMVLVWSGWKRLWRSCALTAAGLGSLIAVDVTMKSLVARPRPPLGWHAVLVPGWSFPSGHALLSLGVVLLLVWTARRHGLVLSGVRGYALGVLVACVVIAVGASRLVLGVHYPSDVLAGWALAVFVVGVGELLEAVASGPGHTGTTDGEPLTSGRQVDAPRAPRRADGGSPG